MAVLSQSELFHTRTGVTISVPPGLTCVALQATVTPAWCLSTCAVTTTWIPECPGKCKCEDKGLPPPPGLAGPALGEASLVRPSMQPTDIGRYVGAPPTHATPAADMASRDFAAGLRLDASASAAREQPRSMTPGVMDMGSSAAREQEHYVRIHKFNFTELAMRRLAADKLSQRAAQTEEGLERNNAAGGGEGSGHSKKLLAKKLLVSGKKMQAQKQLRIARSAKGERSERASTSSEHLRMGSSSGAPGGGLTKQGLAKIEADAKRAGLKAGFKAGMAATMKKAATAHKVKMAKGEVSAAKKNLAVGNSKKLVSKSHLLHPKTAKAIKDQQYANSKKFAVKHEVQQEIEEEASDEVAKAQNSMSFNKKRKLKGQKKGSSKQQVLTKKLGAAKKRSSIDIGLQKDEFKALLMAQTEAYSKRPGVTSLVASEEKASGPAGLNPNKHSELWLAKHGNQVSEPYP